MGTEIERKFLVTGSAWRNSEPVYVCQGYLNRDKHRTVRVRIAGDRGILTIKGLTTGVSRPEFEYEIPIDEAREMLVFCAGPVVKKFDALSNMLGWHGKWTNSLATTRDWW